MWWEGGDEFHAPTWPATYEKIVLNLVVFCWTSQRSVWIVLWTDLMVAPKANFPLTKRRKTTWCGWRRPPVVVCFWICPNSNSHHVKSQHVGLSSHVRSTAFLRASSTAGSCGMSSLDPCCYPTLCTWYPPKKILFCYLGQPIIWMNGMIACAPPLISIMTYFHVFWTLDILKLYNLGEGGGRVLYNVDFHPSGGGC